MGAKGSQQVQQNSQYTPNPAITQAGGTALDMATKAAQSPFQQPAAPVAGFNQQQQQAFGQTGALQGFAQPYFDQASQFVNQSAAPITGQDVNQYYNPFAQNVFNAQNDLFGQQMQETTGNLTQAAGGVGADRIAVGQSELARQQQLARGQTAAGLYGQALSAAQQQKANEAQAGFAMGSFGPAAQNAQLQGTQALLGTGGLQQQQAQAQLNSPYQQQLAKLAFPYQNSQFLAGIAGGLAPGMGGFNSGNTTYPGASPWGTVAGLGTVGAGIYGLGNQQGWWGGGGNNSGDWVGQASGGRVSPFDAGGSVAFGDDPFKDLGATSIVPDIALKPGSGYHAPPQAAQQQQSGSGGFGMNDAIGLATKALPLLFAAADGGAVSPFSQGRGYDDGGNVDFGDRFGAAYAPATFADRYSAADPGMPATIDARWPSSPFALQRQPSPVQSANGTAPNLHFGNEAGVVQDAIKSGQFDPQGGNYTNFAGAAAVPALPSRSIPAVASDEPATESVGATPGARFAQNGSGASPFTQNGMPPAPDFSASSPDESTTYAKSPYSALINAGLGMLAASGQRDAHGLPLSPFAAIGKGGMEGMKTLEEQRSAAQKDKQIEQQAKHLQEEATRWRTINPYQAAELDIRQKELERQNALAQYTMMQPIKVMDPNTGVEVSMVKDPSTGQFHRIDPRTGSIDLTTPDTHLMAAEGEAPLHGDEFLATLDKGRAEQIKAMAEGRVQMPTGLSASKPMGQALIRDMLRYDSNADVNTLATRRKNFLAFSPGGNLGIQSNSLVTALDHLTKLSKAGDALNNYRSPLLNTLSNEIKTSSGKAAVTNFNGAASKVAEEVTRTYRGAGGAEADIIRELKNINPNMSPEQIHGAIDTIADLMKSKLQALKSQYYEAMGPKAKPLMFEKPEVEAKFDYLHHKAEIAAGREKPGQVATPAAGTAANSEVPPMPEAKKAGDGKWYVPDPKRPGKYLQVNP